MIHCYFICVFTQVHRTWVVYPPELENGYFKRGTCKAISSQAMGNPQPAKVILLPRRLLIKITRHVTFPINGIKTNL